MQETKKKLLILIDWFAPGYKAGGPIRSCINMAIALRAHFDIYILTTDTDYGEIQPYKNIRANEWTTGVLGPDTHIYYLEKKGLRLKQVKEQINFVAPDFVYLNLLFSPYFTIYPMWLKYNHKIAGKMILSPRGTLYDSALSVKRYKKKLFLLLFKWLGIYKEATFHATNTREKEAIQKYFPESNIVIADNIADPGQLPFCSINKIPGSLKCIFISRIVPIKNLLFFLNVLQQVKAAIHFTIVGPVEDETYWHHCQQKIAQLPVNIKVNIAGARPHQELISILQQHHLFILPTKGENFGHVIFEALLAGRPVLISDQTPWLNLATKNAGWDISLNDQDSYISTVEKAADWNQEAFDSAALSAWQFAKHTIEITAIKQQYLELFS